MTRPSWAPVRVLSAVHKNNSEGADVKRKAVLGMFHSAWRAYTYIYYRIYAANLRVAGESDLPQWNAMFGVSALLFMNVVTVVSPIDFIWNSRVIFNAPLWHGLLLLAVIGFCSYLGLIRRERYIGIADGFSKESSIERKRHTWFCWIYASVSVISPFVVGFSLQFTVH